ncbi:hypothetical protein C2G38_2111520 [Gigaspora rosea]|uniref:Uncharacterized protein n=1 Tax=Gigaspora rosea TaxID=44941 RepID=A0A397UDC4_9GLOM|nr:hypothetical protein C2G38_2111520 [Gigaspora rosea]
MKSLFTFVLHCMVGYKNNRILKFILCQSVLLYIIKVVHTDLYKLFKIVITSF